MLQVVQHLCKVPLGQATMSLGECISGRFFHRGDQDGQSTPHFTDSLPIGLNLFCNYVFMSNQLYAPLTVQPGHPSALSYVEGTPNVLAGHKSWPPPTRASSRPGGITKIMIQNGFMDLLVQVFLLFLCLNNNVLSVLKQQQDVPLELN